MPELNVVTVDPGGIEVAVDITKSGGGSVTAYSSSTGVSALSLPATISTPTEFWLVEAGDFTFVFSKNSAEFHRETIGVSDREDTPKQIKLTAANLPPLALAALLASAPSGASSTTLHKIAFAWNTAGIVVDDGWAVKTGASLFTPTAGDVVLSIGLSVITAFDGTTPTGYAGFVSAGLHVAVGATDLTITDAGSDPPGAVQGATWFGMNHGGAPIAVAIDAGGSMGVAPAGMAHGAGFLYVLTATPA